MNLDIAKKYTTRDGRRVVIFEVSDKVYCKVEARLAPGRWFPSSRRLDGKWGLARPHDCDYAHAADLIPAKTWRAWKEGEAPARVMLRQKGCTFVETKRTKDCDLPTLFLHYVRVYEDGTETPCGVEE